MIDELDVSDSWKKKFEILEKAGGFNGLTYENAKSLSFMERQKISFNILAFIFGPFYYFFKKMWGKGAVLFGLILLINIIITIIELAMGTSFPIAIYQVPGAAICASLANYDFYRFKVYQETMWKPFSFFNKPVAYIGFPVVFFVILSVISYANNDIEKVRNGVLSMDQTVTIGGAFDNYKYFANKEWNLIETDQGRKIVEFRGSTDPYPFVNDGDVIDADKQAAYKITYVAQFALEVNGDNFETSYSGLEIINDGNKTDQTDLVGANITVKEILQNNPTHLVSGAYRQLGIIYNELQKRDEDARNEQQKLIEDARNEATEVVKNFLLNNLHKCGEYYSWIYRDSNQTNNSKTYFSQGAGSLYINVGLHPFSTKESTYADVLNKSSATNTQNIQWEGRAFIEFDADRVRSEKEQWEPWIAAQTGSNGERLQRDQRFYESMSDDTGYIGRAINFGIRKQDNQWVVTNYGISSLGENNEKFTYMLSDIDCAAFSDNIDQASTGFIETAKNNEPTNTDSTENNQREKGVTTAASSSTTGASSPFLVIKAVPQTTPDTGIKSKSPVEVIGKIEFGQDAAGGNFQINGGKKKQYTLGYVWDIDDTTQGELRKLADSGTTVAVKGTLKTWKDGGASFDNADSISIFKQQ